MTQRHQKKEKGIFKIFISSTFRDLEKERKGIKNFEKAEEYKRKAEKILKI